MRRLARWSTKLAVAAAAAAIAACGPASGTSIGAMPSAGVLEREILREVNEVRASSSLPQVWMAECAAPVAQSRAGALRESRDLVHAPLADVFAACETPRAAENLARGGFDAEQVVQAWLDSPGHRANLLDPALISGAVGCVAEGTVAVICSLVLLS